MKIAVISSSVFAVGEGGLKGYGGLEQIAWLLAKGLAAKGHEVTLVAPDESTCPGCKVHHTGPAGKHDEWSAFRGYRYAQRDVQGQEIKDAQGNIQVTEVPAYWPMLLKQDVVIDHSWAKWAYTLKQEGTLKCPILGVTHAPVNTMWGSPPPVEKPCIVCISEDQASHYRALFNQDARCAYNGVDGEFYKPLNVPRSDRFLFLARFSSIKGADLAIEACKQAVVGLDLVGDTSITNEPDFYHKCASMCDGKQIRMIGPCSRGETVWWYSQAHAMLHPNMRFREPLGLAPIEAMLCGCPVIAWDNGAMRETVYEARYRLVRSISELVDMIKDHARGYLHKKGELTEREACREWALKFSVERMVDRYEELSLEAIKTGGW